MTPSDQFERDVRSFMKDCNLDDSFEKARSQYHESILKSDEALRIKQKIARELQGF